MLGNDAKIWRDWMYVKEDMEFDLNVPYLKRMF